MGKKIILITACGRVKENYPLPAWQLYKSPRIKFLKKESDKFGIDFYILSAKHGLIHSEEIIKPYEAVMIDYKGILHVVVNKLRNISPTRVVYYKGGARNTYFKCINEACSLLDIELVSFGYANMGDIRRIKEYLDIGG